MKVKFHIFYLVALSICRLIIGQVHHALTPACRIDPGDDLFLDGISSYFDSGLATDDLIVDLRYYHYAVSQNDSWKETCWPAALVALALKADELSTTTGDGGVLTDFLIANLQPAISACIQCMHAFPWINKLLQFPRSFSPQERHSVDFVVSFCGAPSHQPSANHDHLKTNDSLTWLADILERAGSHKATIRLFIQEKCAHTSSREDRNLRYHELTLNVSEFVEAIHVTEVLEELRADDCTAYLAHISDRYHDLAEMTFFVHPDIYEHAYMGFVRNVILGFLHRGLRDIPFLYLSHNYIDLSPDTNTLWEQEGSSWLWKTIFGSSITPPRSNLKGYCCSQFVVSRERIQLRQEQFYSEALAIFKSAESYVNMSSFRVVTEYDKTCRTPCQLNMPWWHIYFGEDLTYEHHARRVGFPMSLRMHVWDS